MQQKIKRTIFATIGFKCYIHIYDTWTGLNVESWFSFTSSVLLFDDEFVFVEWADRFVMGNDPGLFKDVMLCIPLLGPIGKIIISNIA